MRLDKYLAESHIGTRKFVRKYVQDGKVKVNNEIELNPAIDINETIDVIKYLDKVVEYTGKEYYMFNKPSGCITARKDDNDTTIMEYFKDIKTEGLFPVGRLDKDTEGLLIITNDGEFDHMLMHPDNHVEKTYFFWAFGTLEESNIEKFKKGIYINNKNDEKNIVMTKPSKIEILNDGYYEDYKDKLKNINYKKISIKKEKQKIISGYITISEGKKHQVKRMLKYFNCYVIYLKRVKIGNLNLDNNLKPGEYRKLFQNEIEMINK